MSILHVEIKICSIPLSTIHLTALKACGANINQETLHRRKPRFLEERFPEASPGWLTQVVGVTD